MNESLGWTVGLGRWRGVRVRVHVLLVAFAVSVLWWGMSDELGSPAYGPLCVAALWVSVCAREMARLWMARFWAGRDQVIGLAGSEADEIVLWPMGGWLVGEPTDDRRGEVAVRCDLAVALAAPLAGGVLMVLGGAVLLVMASVGIVSSDAGTLVSLLPPSPTMLEGSGALVSVAAAVATAAALLVWVNGALLVINLLPMGSLDAAHVFRAVLRDDGQPQRQERMMARVAVATAVALVVLGWMVWDVQPGASLVLALVAVGMCRRDHAVVGSTSSARGCVAGTATVGHQPRGCHPRDAIAGLCGARGRVCGSRAVARCFDLPRRHRAGGHVQPIAGGPKGSAGDGASDAGQNGAGQVDTLWGEVPRPGRGEIRSVERARLYRAGIWRRRRRS